MKLPTKFTIKIDVDDDKFDIVYKEDGKEEKDWSKCTLQEGVALQGACQTILAMTKADGAVFRFLKNTGLDEYDEIIEWLNKRE